ncbi:hypothetical protein COY25_03210 [Candidatus Uhrbacteria bacterium CG_4_10_14_0_2_um_filter_41_7]|uniref:Zinc finger DksA/TraR C4-type domain-containing protein n=1 Tax=Candidatus Uhrbacteria bacterium CG_4_9_14_3_um_filter_41_35 TaxID=1975034 RepID=A0A2M7XDI5_9BACT|nr:MAG: hypothetical protein COV92_03615 [Candidatus Uhrbacteria bacterium CG11_big_fil_rev_8_21_14_0_20_41_9]PIZ53641.1 MAG: hypothetical protein COY25_03210 [Candidatus Uhrbacteria bacterium CG_4_10_14_0_2_um_filter_41_7]PJA45892.1 MAG: hypothetical protein CO173_04235 [Candidatus Uhrbacteria bacterium CG_4_9_14_3_um_filter_41_35]
MNKQSLDEMRVILTAEKEKLENELSRFAHRNTKAVTTDFDTDYPDFGEGEDENASEIATYSNNLSLESELEKSLRDVTSALKLVENGTYGKCKYCKADISEARLKARPTASSCIACKKTLTQEL